MATVIPAQDVISKFKDTDHYAVLRVDGDGNIIGIRSVNTTKEEAVAVLNTYTRLGNLALFMRNGDQLVREEFSHTPTDNTNQSKPITTQDTPAVKSTVAESSPEEVTPDTDTPAPFDPNKVLTDAGLSASMGSLNFVAGMKQLPVDVVETLVRVPGVRRIAVENFLVTCHHNQTLLSALLNLNQDANLYQWDNLTVGIISVGLLISSGSRKASEVTSLLDQFAEAIKSAPSIVMFEPSDTPYEVEMDGERYMVNGRFIIPSVVYDDPNIDEE